ncbi:benzil reductase ((S)-benzoin forming) [Pontibacter ummariensis]|uniref:Benzil reductase ((S)-benzoin forming) n=1 Tax=Pontibacter ummariensis TaxID=1610492 RepID=A0A239E634_9BACT|nr:SDR family NAD(P)-dependent oxidoreductase [Pontibacter ummariensis]PRY13106.1 benzil reductase ((S)-benzoin forming) [Pontibacter ummariensis]SNS40200.1 benzil reductase ((S)-benzoin forming) [Pontibacter ummariensis]
MNIYIITGASKGIGKAIAEELLKDENNQVIGLSRSSSIAHPNYRHHPIDFSDLTSLEKMLPEVFLPYQDAARLGLINNAGVLGDIGYVGEDLPNETFKIVFDVNVVAPAMLMNTFLKTYRHHRAQQVVVNISSGAGKYPVDGWASYCASKAAIDMLSQTAQQEQDIRGTGVKVFALSPGVVDTEMQGNIRSSDATRFSNIQRFKDYKAKGELTSPEEVGRKVVTFLNGVEKYNEVIVSLRDM